MEWEDSAVMHRYVFIFLSRLEEEGQECTRWGVGGGTDREDDSDAVGGVGVGFARVGRVGV